MGKKFELGERDKKKLDGYLADLINQGKGTGRLAVCPTCNQEIAKPDGATYRFVIMTGKDSGVFVPVSEGKTVTLGRGEDCEIVLADPHVSRRHCEFKGQEKFCVLTDLDSGNGTMINGERVKSKQLSSGDVIKLGKTRIVFGLDPTQ